MKIPKKVPRTPKLIIIDLKSLEEKNSAMKKIIMTEKKDNIN